MDESEDRSLARRPAHRSLRDEHRPQPPAADGAPRGMNGDQRFELILSTAEKLIHERGFLAVSIRDLAAAVGIKVASLYYYFPSKDRILYAICKRHMERLLEATRASLETAGPGIRERLTAVVDTGVLCHIQDQSPAGVMIAETRNLVGEEAAVLRTLTKEYETIFVDLVREGTELGEFQGEDAVMDAYVILGAITRIPVWYRADGRLSAVEVARHYTNALMRTVGSKAAC